MKGLRLPLASVVLILWVIFAKHLALAQATVLCDVTCAPDPTASSYAGAAAARSTVRNARGHSSPTVARAAIATMSAVQPPSTVVGSQSYNYAIPILHWPGRAGMDLVLNAYYNSRVWSVDTVNGTASFNIDRDFPSYGFRLDFGYLEHVSGFFVVTEGDGTKHTLSLAAAGKYDSTDGTYMEYNSQTNVLVYKNGVTIQYQPFPSNASLLRPVWIKDTNGNFISIAYVSGHDQFISQISDTLGRVVTFNYDPTTHLLANLTQAVHPSGTQTYVTFQWGTAALNYAFDLAVINTPASGASLNVLTGCTYSNGTGYRFTYGDWGIITKIESLSAASTPATRSYVSYDYPLASAGALSDAPAYTKQTVSPDGTTTNASSWSYAVNKDTNGAVTSMAITDPNGNVSTTNLDGSTGLVSSVTLADNANNTLQTTAYTWTTSGVGTVPQIIQSTNDAGQTSKIQYAYDGNGNPLTTSEYDFDGTVKRITATTYSSAYAAQHILNLPTMVQVEDGASKVIARTDLAYDSTSLTSVTGANGHDDQSFGATLTARGNLTAVTRYANAAAGTGAFTRNFYYDALGNMITAQLDCCNQKQFNFSSVTQYSAPDSVVRGPSGGTQFTTSYTYNPDNNQLLSSTDENGQTTIYEYDSMSRLTEVTLPPQNGASGAQLDLITAYADDTALPTITKSNGANSLVSVTTMDGLGHLLEVDNKNGGTLISSVKYGYDKVWRRIQASNPFAPSDTQVNTTFSYDALGRLLQSAPPSGGSMQYSYSGNTVTITEPAGKQRKNISDALGRLVEVDEPVPGTAVNAASGSATVGGTEQSAQVLVTPAAAGTGSVTLGGAVQWSTVSNASTGGTTNITINGAEQQRPVGVIPGTGSVTLSGSEQVIPATTASATLTVGGSLQSEQVQTQVATQATANVTISGAERSVTIEDPCPPPPMECPGTSTTYFDSGTVTITVNGNADSYSYGPGDTSSSVASGLALAINRDTNAPVTARASGAIVYLASNLASSSANSYSLSASASTDDPADFLKGSFSAAASASSLSGGQDAQYTTVYDHGASSVTLNNSTNPDATSWSGSGTTPASIAQGLCNAINGDSSAPAKASTNGTPGQCPLGAATVGLTAKSAGKTGNVPLSCAMSYDTSDFSTSTFTIACPSALSGGKDAIYDTGTVKLTVNGHADSYNFGAGDTLASIASGLAANINADGGAAVSASASGATVNLSTCFPYATSCSAGGRTTLGSIANYSIDPPTVSYDTTDFSRPSFAAASGAALTGGWPNPNAIDSGNMIVTITPAGATSGTNYQVSWGKNSTTGTIASQVASALSSDPTVKPTFSNGTTVYLDPRTPGASYSFSTAFTYDSGDFTHSSFSSANSISDYGRATITVNGHPDSVNWAGHDTPTSIAANLASAINGDSPYVNASATNGALALAAKSAGGNTNYSLAPPPSDTFDTAHFSSASFSSNASGAALTGGVDAVYKTVYDAGTVWMEVDGFQASAPYQQGSTPGAIANALAGQFNGTGSPVTATVSGATLTLTASQKGLVTNYSLSSGATTSQSANFAQPSFSSSVSSDDLTGGSDTAPAWQATTYSYDPLGNLTQVTQGAQTRSFNFDGLGRVTSSTTPESGAVTTYYTDASGNSCAGDPTLACRVQDARGVTKTFTYDGINRIAGVSYSDGTPAVSYQYDSGGAAAFALDRMTKITEGANSQIFTYDNFGRMTAVSQVIDQTTYLTKYAYNLAGQLNSITYPTGRVVAQNVDAIGRLSSVSDGSATYLNNLSYNAAGEPLGLTLGNGVQGAFTYNDHLQLAGLRYSAPGAASDVLNLQYDYGTNNNGQIQSVRYYTAPGLEDTTKSQYFTYDLLGRLATAHTGQVNSTAGTWALAWSYDRWGNRLSQTLTGGNVAVGQPNLTIDSATNRITNTGVSYDAAGNMTNDGANAYTFDGANRMTQVGSNAAAYTYFGPLRIKKVNGNATTVYIYSGSQVIVEYLNGVVNQEYIYAGRTLLATLAGGNATYHHPDHLSNRAETDASGNPVRAFGHLPFGEIWYESGTPDKLKFTGYERDSDAGETGLDYAEFRHYTSRLGRFMIADLKSGNPAAPQSWNRFAYVLNDPINLVDPNGLECVVLDDGTVADDQQGAVCDHMTMGNGQPDAVVDGSSPADGPPQDPPPPPIPLQPTGGGSSPTQDSSCGPDGYRDATPEESQSILDAAKSFEGVRYSAQGGNSSVTNGMDCSGMVFCAINKTGIPYSYSNTGDIPNNPALRSIDPSQARSGDVVLATGHVGFFDAAPSQPGQTFYSARSGANKVSSGKPDWYPGAKSFFRVRVKCK